MKRWQFGRWGGVMLGHDARTPRESGSLKNSIIFGKHFADQFQFIACSSYSPVSANLESNFFRQMFQLEFPIDLILLSPLEHSRTSKRPHERPVLCLPRDRQQPVEHGLGTCDYANVSEF